MKRVALLMPALPVALFFATSLVALGQQPAAPLVPVQVKISPLPPGSMVTIKMNYRASGAVTASSEEKSSTRTAQVYKGTNSRFEIVTHPGTQVSYKVRIGEWQFVTDHMASPELLEHVSVAAVSSSDSVAPDFPELNFESGIAKAEATTDGGRRVIILSAAPAKARLTEAVVKQVMSTMRDSPERSETLKNLRAAQEAEKKAAASPPNRVWLDAATLLPLRAEAGLVKISYTYSVHSGPPQIPQFMHEAISRKLQNKPPPL